MPCRRRTQLTHFRGNGRPGWLCESQTRDHERCRAVAAQPPGGGVGPRDPITSDQRPLRRRSWCARTRPSPFEDAAHGLAIGPASVFLIDNMTPPSTVSCDGLNLFDVAFQARTFSRRLRIISTFGVTISVRFRRCELFDNKSHAVARRSSAVLILDELECDPFTEDSRKPGDS